MKMLYYNLTREQLEQFLQLAMWETLEECARRGWVESQKTEEMKKEQTLMILTRDSLLEKFADWLLGKGNESHKIVMVALPAPTPQKEQT